MTTLDDAAVDAAVAQLAGWRREGRAIARSFRFADFRAALAFVNRVGAEAERHNHHPDIAIHYAEVTLTLWSHDAGGVTGRDLRLAKVIDALRD
jgi:4a-hydroxytetrahydrobiopterin dehydratase